ncbi:PH domain-containing protein [Roseimaritima sediminicola]|uniref:PH domain-containing protein n=1 Tax=Roseimaritima sediminicola TaxID=2662066 RepID=UPI0012984CED|nr:PH domain-containing protein [Roseimaritima sediminicola]
MIDSKGDVPVVKAETGGVSDPSSSEGYSKLVYEGIWRVMADWFRVPRVPPVLPAHSGEEIIARKPAESFLGYLRLTLAAKVAALVIGDLVLGIILTINHPVVGGVLTPLTLLGIVAVALVGLVAVRLRYDTTWYVFSDRSMRLRRGIWLIRETTITFENIQNVQTRQGPVQRFFGIADVIVETAGGGAAHQQDTSTNGHHGLIEGIENAAELRDKIRRHIAAQNTGGLGDEDAPEPAMPARPGLRPQHVAVLREIDQLLKATR